MNVFISWQVWINDELNDDVVKRYHLMQVQDSRLDKTVFYVEFLF